MLNDIKILLGEASGNYSDDLIGLCAKQALAEVEAYCNRPVDYELEQVAIRIAIIRLNRINTEGLAGQAYSGISENYIDGYPEDIKYILNRKRRIKTY